MSESTTRMTMAGLKDWLVFQGCEIKPLQEFQAKVILIYNPKTDRSKFLYPPFDKPLKDYTIYKICCELGVQIPDYVKYLKPLHDKINKENNGKK